MLIILEGPDGAGKSTLAQKLAAELGDDVTHRHAAVPRHHPLVEYEVPLLGYQPGLAEHVICDRWHLGELIYPALLGRPRALTPEVLWHVEAFLLRRGAVVVHVDQPVDVLAARLRARGDDLIAVGQLPELRAAYDETMRRTLLPSMAVTGVTEILARGVEQEQTFRGLAPFSTYVGPRYPSLLLLGEERNPRKAPWARSPAFMPFPSTSGQYLLTCLAPELLPVDRRRVGVANACDVDDVAELYQALAEPSRVVALGTAAQRACQAAGVPAQPGAHPQWVRRFHHHARLAYARQVLYGEEPRWS